MQDQTVSTLWEVAQSLYQYLNINDLIIHINHRIKSVLAAEGVSMILYDERRDELVFCWVSSDADDLAGKLKKIHLPKTKGIAGSVFTSGRAEIINNVAGDKRHYRDIDDELGFQTHNILVAPLKKKRKTIGVIEVLNKTEAPFDENDLTFLTTLAPIIAMALDNARMYGELDGAYRQLQEINQQKDELIQQTQCENILLRKEIENRYPFEGIIGKSPAILEVFRLCEKVIDLDITVLIEGETGTGKELIARCLHYNSPRRNKAFVTQNCAGIPETLLTSELFGHKKGAFTGAMADKKGLFEIAHGGTIFLDEVGEMPAAMQTGLLRVLQDGEIRPLGSNKPITVNTRLISATNCKLEEMVTQGRFREDLWYRLNVLTIQMPPLRQRSGDIPLLVNHFIAKNREKMKTATRDMAPEALAILEAYPFPGNVRELENEIERAMALAHQHPRIEPHHLSDRILRKTSPPRDENPSQSTLKEMVTTLEKSVLTRLLSKRSGNRTQVARELGLSRYGLQKKIQRYGL